MMNFKLKQPAISVLLLFVLIVLSCSALAPPTFRRVLRGDKEQLNNILSQAKASIPANNDFGDLRITESTGPFGGIKIYMKVTVGDNAGNFGECNDFAVHGDLIIEGESRPKEIIDGKYMERYDITILGEGIQVRCQVPLKVKIEKIKFGFPIDGDILGQDGKAGTLTVFSSDISFGYTISFFSEDFSKHSPTVADANGPCSLSLGQARFDADKVLVLFSKNTKGINLDDKIEDALKKDPSLIAKPATDGICAKVRELGHTLTDLVMFNQVTNDASEAGNTTMESKIIRDALLSEASLLLAPGTKPLDLSFLNSFFQNEGTLGADILDSMSQFLNIGDVDNSDPVAFAISALNSKFGTNINENLQYANVLEIINVVLDKPHDSPFVLLNKSMVTDMGNISLMFSMDSFVVNRENFTEESLLSLIGIAGKHSIMIPEMSLGDFLVSGNFTLLAELQSDGVEGFLPMFSLRLNEDFALNAVIEDLSGGLAAMLPIDLSLLEKMQLGPFLNSPLKCISAALVVPLTISSVSIETSSISASTHGFEDLIAVVLGDVFNVISFVYQSVPAPLLESFLKKEFADPIMDKGTCPAAVVSKSSKLYDFSQGIFSAISGLVDGSNLETIIKELAGTKETLSLISEPVHYGFNVLPLQGWAQRVELTVRKLDIGGILPPRINEVSITVPTTSPNFPQGIVALADVFDNSSQFYVTLALDLNTHMPFKTGDSATDSPPTIFRQDSNSLEITFKLSSVKATLDLFAKLSQYGVDSMFLGNMLRFECWAGRILSPGGWNEIAVLLDGVYLDFACNCTTPILLSLQTALLKRDDWVQVEETLQELVNTITTGVVNRHSTKNFDATVANAQSQCPDFYGDQLALSATTRNQSPQADPGPYLLIVVLGLCILIKYLSCCFPFLRRPEPFVGKERDTNLYCMKAMCQHRSIPVPFRVIISSALLINLSMFIYGDSGTAISMGFEAMIFGVPFVAPEFGSYSIISSTVELYQSGAVGLALFITLLVIAWPFVKLVALTICWFMPVNCAKTLTLRGKVLHFMDAVGKWSLLEFVFVILLLLMFNINVGSPDAVFLPAEDLYFLSVNVSAESSFYVFTAAVFISLVLSNLMVTYHERIIHRSEKLALMDTEHCVYHHAYVVGRSFTLRKEMSPVHLAVVSFALVMNLVLLSFATFTYVIEIRYLGMVALLLRIEGSPSQVSFSPFSIGQAVLTNSGVEAETGFLFMGIVYLISQLLMPFIVLFVTIYLMFGSFTVKSARRWQRLHSIVQAWSTIEVFTLAIVIAVVEIEGIAKELKTKECDLLKPVFQDVLLPVGLASQEDVDATCFGINLQLRQGAYMLVVAACISAFLSVVVTKYFAHAIEKHLSGLQENIPVKNGILGRPEASRSGKEPSPSQAEIVMA